MINKDKQLTDQLRKNVVWADLGDSKAKGNLEAIWKTLKAQEFTEKSDPIIVVHPNGESEVYQSKAETQKQCRIGFYTLQKCIETGEPDYLGRCYDYLIM